MQNSCPLVKYSLLNSRKWIRVTSDVTLRVIMAPLLCFVLHCMDCTCFVLSLSVSLLDISRTLIINYRWPAAIGLVPLWQPAKYV